jgi:type I restriction enzyme S subunit
MIADLKPYPEYKHLPQLWAGKVPRHWSVMPNRALFSEVKDRNHPDEEMLSVTITKGIVRQKALLEGTSKRDGSNQDKTAYKLVQPRDLAYNKMRAWQGAIGASRLRGIISPAYVVVRLRGSDDMPEYFHHLYRTPLFAKEAERWSYGITSDMWSLRPEHFKMIYTPLPPVDEQAAIVRFVEWASDRLERAIRAKGKVISLFREQKQAIINDAVTRGLAPGASRKPGGIPPWLDDIPNNCMKTRLGRVCLSIRDGTHNPPPAAAGVHRLLSVRNIIGSRFVTRPDDRTMEPKAYFELQRSYTVQAGDVVVALVGATTGKSAIVEPLENVTVQRSLGILRPNLSLVRSEFLHLLISSPLVQGQIGRIMNKYAAQPGIYLEELGGIQVIFPSLDDQASVVAHVKSQAAPITASIGRVQSEIDLLREYRSRLVADIVTGKLDVREAVARIQNEASLGTDNDVVELTDDSGAEDLEAVA